MNEKIKQLQDSAASMLHSISTRRDEFNQDQETNQRSAWTEDQDTELTKMLDEYQRLQSQIKSETAIAELHENAKTSRGLNVMGNQEGGSLKDGQNEDAYNRAFANWVKTGVGLSGQYEETWTIQMPGVTDFKDDNVGNYRALAVGTGDGGHAIREDVARAFVVAQYANDSLREAGATVRSTATGSDWRITTFHDADSSNSSGFNLAPIKGEGQDSDEQDPSLDEVVMKAFVYRGHVDVSKELDQDDVVGLMSELPSAVGGRISRNREKHHTDGTGSGQPTGLLTAIGTSGSDVLSRTRASIRADETGWTTLIDLFNAVGRAYRRNGTWMMNTATLSFYLKMKDGQGRPLFLADVRSDLMVGPFNRPMVVNDWMPAEAAANTASSYVLYGDFGYYYIRDVRAIEITRNIFIVSQKNQIRLEYSARGDGQYVNPGNNPVVLLRSTN